MSEKRFTLLAGGLIIGALAGVVAGLLAAPKSGRETRTELASKAKDAACRLQGEVEKAREKSKVAYDSLLGRLRELEGRAERKAREIRSGSGTAA